MCIRDRPIIAATILLEKTIEIENLPHLKDISTMLELLNSMGSEINFLESGGIEINSSKILFIIPRLFISDRGVPN